MPSTKRTVGESIFWRHTTCTKSEKREETQDGTALRYLRESGWRVIAIPFIPPRIKYGAGSSGASLCALPSRCPGIHRPANDDSQACLFAMDREGKANLPAINA